MVLLATTRCLIAAPASRLALGHSLLVRTCWLRRARHSRTASSSTTAAESITLTQSAMAFLTITFKAADLLTSTERRRECPSVVPRRIVFHLLPNKRNRVLHLLRAVHIREALPIR